MSFLSRIHLSEVFQSSAHKTSLKDLQNSSQWLFTCSTLMHLFIFHSFQQMKSHWNCNLLPSFYIQYLRTALLLDLPIQTSVFWFNTPPSLHSDLFLSPAQPILCPQSLKPFSPNIRSGFTFSFTLQEGKQNRKYNLITVFRYLEPCP